jgi:hypothetical protein
MALTTLLVFPSWSCGCDSRGKSIQLYYNPKAKYCAKSQKLQIHTDFPVSLAGGSVKGGSKQWLGKENYGTFTQSAGV